MLILKDILAKEAKDLNDAEKAFLKEHQAELTEAEKVAYKDILESDPEVKDIEIEKLKDLMRKEAAEAFKSVQDEAEKKAAVEKKLDEMVANFMVKVHEGVEASRKRAIDPKGDRDDEKSKGEVTKKWLIALKNRDYASCKAISVASGSAPDDTDAYVTVPKELLNEVLRIVPIYGVARRDCRYLPFTGAGFERDITGLVNGVTVTWPGEKGKSKSTQPKFRKVTQRLEKMLATCPLTTEIEEDSGIDILTLLSQLFAEAVGLEEDAQTFVGDGHPHTGILNSGTVKKVVMVGLAASATTVDELIKLEMSVKPSARAGGKYYASTTVIQALRLLKDKNGRYLLQEATGTASGTINGRAFEELECMPEIGDIGKGDAFLIFGNLKRGVVIGDKKSMSVKILTEGIVADGESGELNLAEQDAEAMRVRQRFSVNVVLGDAVSVLVADAEEES
jgi:HK97 family phage major capsid protein